MPRLTRLPVAAAVALLAAAPAAAQKPRLAIKDVAVGLPPGRFVGDRTDTQAAAPVFKRQSWAPVYLKLEVLGELTPGPYTLRVDTTDDDDLKTSVVVPLGNLSDRKPGEAVQPTELPYVPYVRPGDKNTAEALFTVLDPDGWALASERTRYLRARDRSTYVVASLGTLLPGFDLPRDDGKGAEPNPQSGGRGALRGGRVETASVTDVRQLPDQWLGYQSVDLVVLTTGDENAARFAAELFGEQGGAAAKVRRDALLEWVRRGGRLVVTVGANAALLSQDGFAPLHDLLPARLSKDEPSRSVPEMVLSWTSGGGLPQAATVRGKGGAAFPVARLTPDAGKATRVLLPEPRGGGAAGPPLMVQAPFGLGRVTVIGLDLDRSPFVDLPANQRASFWDTVLRQGGAARASVGDGRGSAESLGFNQDREDGASTVVKNHVDDFTEVPVISFGWVALFIALYTLLIGPVEYLFLKKVVGRLELTWVTFPLIVLGVSAAAYFTAYAIKGNDLRINKVDVVDVDPASGRVYGRTWFTLFSPRIDSYTVGVTPRPEWAGSRPGLPTPPTLVDWMAGGRAGGGNIVSRGYKYHADARDRAFADGLVGVPIQVWSTKAFTADWSTWLSPTEPVVESRLYHPPGDPTALRGRVVNRMPTGTVSDAVLLYAGSVYKLDALAPGVPVAPVVDDATKEAEWFRLNAPTQPFTQSNQGFTPTYNQGTGGGPRVANLSLWGLLFYEKAHPIGGGGLENASFRDLDQSWRADENFRGQAVLLAKLGPTSGPAEPLLSDPDAPSPTQLWLNALPGGETPRADVPGTLRQETYLRVYLPVAAKPPAN